MQKYDLKIEEKMKLFYDNLSEKDKRYYAAVEAMKLGHGGISILQTYSNVHAKRLPKDSRNWKKIKRS